MAKNNKKTDLTALSDKALDKELKELEVEYKRQAARGRLAGNQTTILRRDLARLKTEKSRRLQAS